MGNAVQLTRSARRTTGRRLRPAVFAAGTVSMLLITTLGSLALWIALPWVVLGWSPTLVTSGSMSPVLHPGDVALIRPADRSELAPNTVVLYDRRGAEPVLHRIVAELPDGSFQTRGDANLDPDTDPVHADQVEGVAVLAVPWVGRPSLWLTEGRLAPVVATGAVVLVMLVLAPRAFDPAFDPWGSARRINPAEVLLTRPDGEDADRQAAGATQLLPSTSRHLVLARMAAQGAVTRSRTTELLKGLS